MALITSGVTQVTIPAGQSSVDFDIATIQDTIAEGSEDFTITIGNIAGGGFEALAVDSSNKSVTTTITDNEATPTLTVGDAGTVDEGNDATFDVTLSNPVQGNVSYTLTLTGSGNNPATIADDIDGVTLVDSQGNPITGATLTPNQDGTYTATVPGNVTAFSVLVSTTDDTLFEDNEGFTLAVTTTVVGQQLSD
ncbi:hypothetical protein CS022_24685, partial [Veronia nyctiphanis]